MGGIDRINRILEIARMEMDEAALKMSEISSVLGGETASLDELSRYKDEYSKSILGSGRSGMDVTELRSIYEFISGLESAISKLIASIEKHTKDYEDSKSIWMEKRGYVESLDLLVHKYLEEKDKIDLMQEQKLLDEWSSRKRN